MNLENFDPGQLLPPTAVNPRTIAKTAWQVRANATTNKVSFRGVADMLNLVENGVSFAPYGQESDSPIIIWAPTKEDAMTLKGPNAENKMIALVDLLKRHGLMAENEEIAFFNLEAIESKDHSGYYQLVKDEANSPVLFDTDGAANLDDEPQADAPEPTAEEIAEEVVD